MSRLPNTPSARTALSTLAALSLLASCTPTIEMPTPVAYPGACPLDNAPCQRNADAQTLAYIGQPEAALRLMCLDLELSEVISDTCDINLALY